MSTEDATPKTDGAESLSTAGLGRSTPLPMDSGVLIITDAAGVQHEFDANTHDYEVWVNDRSRKRIVEVKIYTDKGSWIVKTINYPKEIRRVFERPNVK